MEASTTTAASSADTSTSTAGKQNCTAHKSWEVLRPDSNIDCKSERLTKTLYSPFRRLENPGDSFSLRYGPVAGAVEETHHNHAVVSPGLVASRRTERGGAGNQQQQQQNSIPGRQRPEIQDYPTDYNDYNDDYYNYNDLESYDEDTAGPKTYFNPT